MKSSVCIICGDKSPIISKRGRKRKKESVCERKLELMLGYLLDNKTSKFDNLKSNILKLKEGKAVGFCAKCELEAEAVLELHLELEKVQMMMIDKLKGIKKSILKLDVAEETSTEEDLGRTIKDFQAAVNEKDKDSVCIPLVFLERHSFIRKENTTYLLLENQVKTEPVSNWDSPPTPDFEDTLENSTDGNYANPEVKPHVTKITQSTSIKRRGRNRKSEAGRSQLGKRKVIRRLLQCEFCPYNTIKPYRYEEHLRRHETHDRPFTCGKCNETFTTKQYLDFHLDLHKKKIRCEVCFEKYNAFDGKTHLKTHADIILPCPQCHKCYISCDNYFAHLKNHGAVGLTCQLCLLPMQSKSALLELMEHLRQVHNIGEEMKCDFEGCGKTFFQPDGFARHKISHTDANTCKICQKKCASPAILRRHEMNHAGLKPLKCDQCTEAFLYKQALYDHIRKVHEGRRLKCKECGKEYISKDGLRSHMITEHGAATKLVCEICGQKFGTGKMLEKHMNTTHSTGERKYVCDECGKSFRAKIHYWVHKRTHGEKTYKCSYCPSAFSRARYLKDHENTHTGARTFICSLCGQVYRQLSSLIVHKRKCGKATN